MNQSRLKHFIYWGTIIAIVGYPVASFSETSGPTVYGKFDISLEHQDSEGASHIINGASPEEQEQWQLNSNASRLGINGTRALEETGLTVIYQAEYEINVDDGVSVFTQRNIFAGLSGEFGQIIAGKFDTPLKSAEDKVDQFNNLRADLDVLIGGQNRVNNIIQYTSPRAFGLVRVNAALIQAEGDDVDADGFADDGLTDSWSLSAVLDEKHLYAALAYDSNQVARRSLDGIARADIIRAVAIAKYAAFETGILLQQAADVTSGSEREDTSYLLSGAYKFNDLKLKIQYGFTKSEVRDEQGQLVAVGLDYALARRTTLYTYVSLLALDDLHLNDRTFGTGLSHSF